VTNEKDRVRNVSADLTQTNVDWVSGLLNSIIVAGLSTATPEQLTGIK
jgi:hypothetical protein